MDSKKEKKKENFRYNNKKKRNIKAMNTKKKRKKGMTISLVKYIRSSSRANLLQGTFAYSITVIFIHHLSVYFSLLNTVSLNILVSKN